MNPRTVMIVCIVIIAFVAVFIISQLPKLIKETKEDMQSQKQDYKPCKGGTFRRFVYYGIMAAILIASGAGMSMLLVLIEDSFSFRNPAPVIWGLAAVIMFAFKPLLRRLFKIDEVE